MEYSPFFVFAAGHTCLEVQIPVLQKLGSHPCYYNGNFNTLLRGWGNYFRMRAADWQKLSDEIWDAVCSMVFFFVGCI